MSAFTIIFLALLLFFSVAGTGSRFHVDSSKGAPSISGDQELPVSAGGKMFSKNCRKDSSQLAGYPFADTISKKTWDGFGI